MGAIPYRPDIQGLRAAAVMSVMVFHANPAWLPGGFVGVDVFLVISGFLIVSILMHQKSRPNYRFTSTLWHFYGSRIKRIAPAYFVMLVFVSLLAAVLFLPQDLSTYTQSLKKAIWFNSNNHFSTFGDYFAPTSYEQPLLHTWSLAVEVQFYLLIPLLVLLLPTNTFKWLLLCLFIGITALAEYRLQVLGILQATYYSLYARLPEFLAGGLVAIYANTKAQKPWLGIFGLIFVLAAAITQPSLGHFPGLPALLPVLGAALILINPTQGIVQKILTNPLIVWVGQLSYSLYLWHWPVLALLRYYTGTQVLSPSFTAFFVILTLILSTSSYYLVEIPLRTYRSRAKQALVYSFLSVATLGTSQSMAKINQTLSPPALPIQYLRYADPATICHGQIVGDCLKGDLSSTNEVLVLGDSHAAMLNLFFDRLGKELGFKARILTASSCVTIPGFDYKRLPEWSQKPCLDQIEKVRLYLSNAKTIFLAASWNWQLESGDFKKSLDHFLTEQSQAGKKIYIFEQEPLLSKNPLRIIRFKSLGFEQTNNINTKYQQSNAKLQHLVGYYPGASSLNFESSGLFSQAPFANGILIYMDEHHLNEDGAIRYADVARSVFEKRVLGSKLD